MHLQRNPMRPTILLSIIQLKPPQPQSPISNRLDHKLLHITLITLKPTPLDIYKSLFRNLNSGNPWTGRGMPVPGIAVLIDARLSQLKDIELVRGNSREFERCILDGRGVDVEIYAAYGSGIVCWNIEGYLSVEGVRNLAGLDGAISSVWMICFEGNEKTWELDIDQVGDCEGDES